MRFILYTGKGGTGKTSISALTAIRAAEEGHKTLVISVDPAHSLSDSLAKKLGPEPTEVSKNLYGMELDVYYSMNKYWGNLRQLLLTVLGWQGVDKIVAEELAALPGMEEASAFLWLDKFYQEKEFDTIIIDSAPTGETLTLLTLPQTTQWWMKKTMPFQRFAVKASAPLMRMATGLPIDKGYEEFEFIIDKLSKVKKLMSDPDTTSMRLVVNPERMVVEEAKRAYTYLQLYGYPVDALFLNRVLPEEAKEGYMKAYYDDQQRYLEEIDVAFPELKRFTLMHQGRELKGYDDLVALSAQVFAEDPTKAWPSPKTFDLREGGGKYFLRLNLPFLDEQKPDVQHKGNELIINWGGKRAHFTLPNMMHAKALEKVESTEEGLLIEFAQ